LGWHWCNATPFNLVLINWTILGPTQKNYGRDGNCFQCPIVAKTNGMWTSYALKHLKLFVRKNIMIVLGVKTNSYVEYNEAMRCL
jgi:hypothetical protein